MCGPNECYKRCRSVTKYDKLNQLLEACGPTNCVPHCRNLYDAFNFLLLKVPALIQGPLLALGLQNINSVAVKGNNEQETENEWRKWSEEERGNGRDKFNLYSAEGSRASDVVKNSNGANRATDGKKWSEAERGNGRDKFNLYSAEGSRASDAVKNSNVASRATDGKKTNGKQEVDAPNENDHESNMERNREKRITEYAKEEGGSSREHNGWRVQFITDEEGDMEAVANIPLDRNEEMNFSTNSVAVNTSKWYEVVEAVKKNFANARGIVVPLHLRNGHDREWDQCFTIKYVTKDPITFLKLLHMLQPEIFEKIYFLTDRIGIITKRWLRVVTLGKGVSPRMVGTVRKVQKNDENAKKEDSTCSTESNEQKRKEEAARASKTNIRSSFDSHTVRATESVRSGIL